MSYISLDQLYLFPDQNFCHLLFKQQHLTKCTSNPASHTSVTESRVTGDTDLSRGEQAISSAGGSGTPSSCTGDCSEEHIYPSHAATDSKGLPLMAGHTNPIERWVRCWGRKSSLIGKAGRPRRWWTTVPKNHLVQVWMPVSHFFKTFNFVL